MIDVFDYFQSDPLGPFYFTLLYATWVSICLSKTPVSIAGGYIFGFPFGLLLSFLGMMIAVFFAFFVVRHAPCTRGMREKGKAWLLSEYRSMNVINIVMQKHPLKACVALRFMYVPSFVKNYFLPLFDVPAAALFLAGSISSFFYCAAFCYVGSTIDTLADAAAGNASGDGGAIKLGLLIGSVVLTFLALLIVTNKVKKFVREQEKLQQKVDVESQG
ncbi:hypothetical protein TrST_g13042 [Triparma strigata]|nr:hypothetical protein TrST_g13042 [Triparma strigata]